MILLNNCKQVKLNIVINKNQILFNVFHNNKYKGSTILYLAYFWWHNDKETKKNAQKYLLSVIHEVEVSCWLLIQTVLTISNFTELNFVIIILGLNIGRVLYFMTYRKWRSYMA